jgi:hypothetical protein
VTRRHGPRPTPAVGGPMEEKPTIIPLLAEFWQQGHGVARAVHCGVPKKELPSVPGSGWVNSAPGVDRDWSRPTLYGRDVDLRVPRFVRTVREPAPIRREIRPCLEEPRADKSPNTLAVSCLFRDRRFVFWSELYRT